MERWMVKSRRIFALLMAVMLLSLFDVTDGRGTISLAAQAADEESTGLVDSGSCGTSANWAFYSDGKLEITGTGEMSFNTAPWRDYREKISKVIIDEGITNIARNAFRDCSSLTSIVIPSTVTEIGGSALQSCSGLTSIEIPSGVTKIEYSALKGCSGLERIEVEEGNSNYDSRDNCNAMIETSSNTLITGCKNTVIPSGVTSIRCFAFYNCTSLTSIEIPAGVTSIEHEAFACCSGLTSIEIPGTVTEIGYSAFYDCSGLASIEIPSGVASIEDGTFKGCSGLTSIEIPAGVASIEHHAFAVCSGLTSIKIPSTVTEIGYSAFEGCSGLERIVVAEGNTVYDSRDNCNAMIETSSNTLIAGCKNTVIPSGVTSIGDSAFYNCTSLTSIKIPDSVTSIGDSAFEGCTSLTSIEIPGTVTKIGSQVFYGCSGLISIEIPSGVTEIGYSAFYDCSSLTGIEIPSGVTKIGYSAFHGCSGLERIVVAEGNTVYDSRDNCNAMIETSSNTLITGCKNTVIPSGVTSIMKYAFYGCSGLTSIEIPSGVTEIGNSAFEGCTSLTSIEISDSVTSLGYAVFNGCSSLERIVVAEGNTVYDSRDNCNAMINTSSNELVIGCKNTVIPSGVTSIGDYAFEGCSGLKSIEIPDSVTSIGDYAFEGCNDLTIYALPGSYAESYAKNKEGISSKIMRFDVQFVSDGKIIDTQSVEYGKAATEPADVGKEGYTLSGWDKDFTEIKEDTTVNAVWTINEYQVTFKDGDTVLDTQTVEHGKAATAPTVAPKEGYTFSWDKDFTEIKEDTTVNAVWTINEYQVTFKDGDTVLNTQTVEYGKPATAPTVAPKEGYTLSWDKEFTEIKADTTVNAVWANNQYQVIFKDGDAVLDTQTVEYGKAATAPAVTQKEGYTLSWDKDFTDIKENITVNAKWSAQQYTVQFDKNGGSKVSKPSITVTYNDKYGALPTAVRKKYAFLGWYTAKSGGSAITSSTKVSAAKDHTLYARWTKVKTKKASIKKVTAGKKKLTVKFGKISGAKGYEVVYSANKKFKSPRKVRVTSTKAVIKKLKSKRIVYVKVRAYKMDSAGKKVYGKFSSVKRVKIK